MFSYGLKLCVYTGESAFEHVLDCKACTALKKPEEASLVSHGDVTLNVESFMHHISVN